MYPGQGSLRGRLIFVSALLLTALFAAALYFQFTASRSLQHNRSTDEDQRHFRAQLAAFDVALYELEEGLYEYAVLMDESQVARIGQARTGVQEALKALRSLANGNPDEHIRQLVDQLGSSVALLDQEMEKLLTLLRRAEMRYPVSAMLSGQLAPANIRFVAATEAAILDAGMIEDRRQREDVLKLLQELRYNWSQQVSAARLYVANQSGLFGPASAALGRPLQDRAAYLHELDGDLARLEALKRQGRLDPRVAASLATMVAARTEHDRLFSEVAALFDSRRWRADVPFFRDHMKPAFAAVRGVAHAMDERFMARTSENIGESLDRADTLTRFLWIVTLAAAAFVISTYLAYARLVRKPIDEVTRALRAFEQGAPAAPVPPTRIKETDALMQAFSDMQRQVLARETRLASILDNAGEGIITVNEQGIVETFNNAAEHIFGYQESEVVGSCISLLLPIAGGENKGEFLRSELAKRTGEHRARELTITAQRRDGTRFPLAIKITELVLDGRYYYTALVEDISEEQAMMDHLRQLAEHDSLTGLYNRQYFMEQVQRVVERSMRQGGLDCALLYMDLDNFKYVNDTLGHPAGDRVLVEVAALLSRRSRRGDLIARLGGDEFAVLLFDLDELQAVSVADDYRQLLSDYGFRHEGRVIDIGCSIGVALLSAGVTSKEELMSRADISCRVAKRAGRNSVHLYRPDDHKSVENMTADMGWARTIKYAIEHDQFDFALQPIVDVRTGRIEKHEALLRMLDVDGKPIMPSGFVPSAERFGLIVDIDRWVVEHAIDLIRRRNLPGENFSINLSGMSIGDPGVLILATRMLEECAIDPKRITFEITETVAIADLSAAIGLLERLREIGCRTALDDFGAGYSSFAYLKDLPVDYVKIDGSFVRNIHEDSLHLAMVKSMNEIAHAMGKKTIAEFVANGQILGVLGEIGVDYAQGFHTGPPVLAGYPGLASHALPALAVAEPTFAGDGRWK